MRDDQLELPFPERESSDVPAGGPAHLGPWEGVEILSDRSEEVSGVPGLLARAGASVTRAELPAGDYLVGRRVLVERKAAGDFANSLYDGRLFRQAAYLRRSPVPSLLVVEGPSAYFERFWPPGLRSALLCLAVDLRVPVLFTRRPEGTAALLLTLGKRCLRRPDPEGYAPAARRRRLVTRRLRRLLESLEALEAVPGMGPRLALAVLAGFGSLEAVRGADAKALSGVRGVGPARARRIMEALSAAG